MMYQDNVFCCVKYEDLET